MSIQKRHREKFSQLRQALLRLAGEIRRLVEPCFSDKPLIKGTVYELKRKCGKPGCTCTRGELHRQMVVSASEEGNEEGKTRLQVIPRGYLVEVQEKVRRYQELRHARARLGAVYQKMMEVIDEMEALRREEMPVEKKP